MGEMLPRDKHERMMILSALREIARGKTMLDIDLTREEMMARAVDVLQRIKRK